jgi:hypothetical protein
MISGVRSKFTLVSNYPKNAIAGVLRPDHSAAVIAGLFFHVSASRPIQISKLELSIRSMLREDGRSALDKYTTTREVSKCVTVRHTGVS